jgi:hypothetical protein
MTAALIPFPQSRNIGKARRVAWVYLGKETAKARDSYWRTITDKMTASFRRNGVPEEEIARQLDFFAAAVNAQIHQLSIRDQGPGAA